MTLLRRHPPRSLLFPAALALLTLAALATGAASYLLDEDARVWWGNGSWSLAAGVAVLGVASARRRSRGDDRSAWTLLLAACVAWLAGELLWWRYAVTTFPASPNPADVLWLLFAVLSGAAVLRFGGRLERGRLTRWLETIPLVIAVVALMTALMWEHLEDTALPTAAQATVLSYPIFYVAVALLMVQAVVSGAIRLRGNPGAAAVVTGLVVEAAAFILWTPQLLDATYVVGGSAIDVLWTLGMLLLGLGAWQARPVRAERDLERMRRRRGGVLPSMIFAALTLFQVVYVADAAQSGAELVLAVGVTVVGAALIARASVVRRQEAQLYDRLRERERELAQANAALARESEDRQAANQELQGILDSAGEGIYGLDCDGHATFVNPAATRLTGHAAEDLLGRRLHDVIHHTRDDGSPYPVDECPIQRALTDGARHSGEDLYWRADGTSFPVSFTSMPIRRDDAVIGAVVVFQDISQRKEVERRKNEFTSVVSHELRTPLTSIRGSLGLMAGGALGEVPPKAQRMLDIAVDNTDRLIRLINDILDIERIESGKVEMNRAAIDVRELVTHAADGMRGMAAEHRVALEWTVDADAVWGDADRIIQTLTNLLSNAIKFSSAGGRVTIDARRRGLDVVFSVRDEGRGIPTDRLDAVFARFEQVDASDARDKGGTGLGLAICRSIVAQHGGRIWAESELGKGSTFRFTIPAVTAAAPAADADAGGPTVVFCDDDAGVREVVIEMLAAQGYRVLPAASGPHLLEILATERPDVVVLDLVMDGLDGWETARMIDEQSQGERLPLVIATVLPREQAGPLLDRAAAYVQKPLDEQALVAAIDRALDRRAPRVLLIEDDEQLAQVLRAGLERQEMDVCLARTGYEAIERAQRLRFDALVLDVALPAPDGFGVVEALRAEEWLSEVPLIVYTARELDEAERARLTLGGPVEFLTKSRTSPGELERQVAAAIRSAAAQERRRAWASAS